MKKTILALIGIIVISSCNKLDITRELPSSASSSIVLTESSAPFIGDPNRTPDLRPVLLEQVEGGDWVGVRAVNYGLPQVRLNTTNYYGEVGNWLRYICPIANDGIPSGAAYSPFVYNPIDGKYSKADFIFKAPITHPDMLYRVVFQHGFPVSLPADNYKQSLEIRDGEHTYLYNNAFSTSAYLNYYPWGDTSALHPGYLDIYFNDVRVPENPAGQYVTVITVNQENYITHARLFNESRYDNNTVTLPVNIEGSSVVIDESALADNTPHPVDSLAYEFIGHGKKRKVVIDWACPYHKYKGVIHKFTIKKNGVVVSEKQWLDSYTDEVGPKVYQPITYEVFIEIEGLGVSAGKTITIK